MNITQGIATDLCYYIKNANGFRVAGSPVSTMSNHVVKFSKNGGTPYTPSGTPTAVGNGKYKVPASSSDLDTLGELSVMVDITGGSYFGQADFQVVPRKTPPIQWAGTFTQGGTLILPFRMTDQNGNPVTGCTIGGTTKVYAVSTGPFASLPVTVYEYGTVDDPANLGMYYIDDSASGYLRATVGSVIVHIKANAKDAEAMVRIQVV